MQELQRNVATHGWTRVPARVDPTISAGLVITVHSGTESTAVLAHADEMLYLAKRNGRNRVETLVLGDESQRGVPPGQIPAFTLKIRRDPWYGEQVHRGSVKGSSIMRSLGPS